MAGFGDRLWGGTALLMFGAVAIGGVAHVYSRITLAPYPLALVVVIQGALVVLLVGFLSFPSLASWGRAIWRRKEPRVLIPLIGIGILGFSAGYLWFAFAVFERLWWQWLPLLLGAPVLLFLVPRYLHLLTAACRQIGHLPGEQYRILPGHKDVVGNLRRATGAGNSSDGDGDLRPQIVAFKGGWGMGKTACLRAFQHQVESEGAGVVVWFDCWRHQVDAQPEFSLYWEVAQNWRVLWPYGWLAVPALRIYLTLLPVIVKATLDLGSTKLEVDDKALREVPRALFWHRHLELLVRWSVRRRGRVVLVMEDIDRCTVPAAQTYVTLTRRFLAVPGMSILVPFVEEQFRPKVFEPLARQMPDLCATTDAVLWQYYRGDVAKRDGDGKLSKIDTALDAYKPSVEAEKPADGQKAEAPSDNIMRLIRPHLLRSFAHADEHERQRVFALLEEKYLCDHVVKLPKLGGADIAHLTLEKLRPRTEWQTRGDGGGQTAWDAVSDQVARHFDAKVAGRVVTPRQYIGALAKVLQEAEPTLPKAIEALRPRYPGNPVGHLACILVHMAYDLAANTTISPSSKESH